MILRSTLAAALLLLAPAPRSGADTSVRVVPGTIDATGASDVTTALNRFFAEVPDGHVIELSPGATYRVEGTLYLRDRRDVVLDGNGAQIFATTDGARDRSHLSVEGGSGIVIRDLVVKGAHPSGGTEPEAWRTDKAFQHGVRILGAKDVELDRIGVTDAFGDLVYVGWDDDGTWSENVWIHDSILARNGRQGIAITAGRNVVIERNIISDTRRATIDLEPDTPSYGAENIHILDNVIGRGTLRFIAAHGNGPVERVVVARNVLRGRDLAIDVEPPDGERRSGFWLLGNESDTEAGSNPLRFTRLDGVVVRGNVQPVHGTRPAVTARDVCGLEVDANTFRGAAEVVQATGAACSSPLAGPQPPTPDLVGRSVELPTGAGPAPDGGAALALGERPAVPGQQPDESAPEGSGVSGEPARPDRAAGAGGRWLMGVAASAALVVAIRRLVAGRRRAESTVAPPE